VFTAVCKSHGGQAISEPGEKSSFTLWERFTATQFGDDGAGYVRGMRRQIVLSFMKESLVSLRCIITRIVIMNNEPDLSAPRVRKRLSRATFVMGN